MNQCYDKWKGSSGSSKEKIETEMKKEIKRLQKLREYFKNQIKGGSDVREKDALLDAQRRIENEMERYKKWEQDSKTKTYSKKGLANAAATARVSLESRNTEERDRLVNSFDELD